MIKKILLPICAFVILTACSSSNQDTVYDGAQTIIQNVSLISMNGSAMDDPIDVIIRGDSIFQIGKAKIGEQTTVIDGSGKYLMPGLTEMHAHIPVPEADNDTILKATLFLYLSQGVTTIRGMLGNPYHLELKKEIENDGKVSPRVYTSSPSLNGGTVPTPSDAREKVRQYKKDGYDFLKIHPGIKLSVWDTLEHTAKSVGIPYAGHVPVEVGIHRALDAKYATVDHLDGFLDGLLPDDTDIDPASGGFFAYNFTDDLDPELIPALVSKVKKQGVAIVPTQTLFTRWFSPEDPVEMLQASEMKYMPAETRFAWRQNKQRMISDESYDEAKWQRFIDIRIKILQEMDKQGVQFLLGSDAPQVMNVPGFSLHHEMNEMSKAGISNQEILESGTSAPAKFFGGENIFGMIKEGLSADLILLDANPLEDISNTQKINGIMYRGEWLSRELIDGRLAEIAKSFE